MSVRALDDGSSAVGRVLARFELKSTGGQRVVLGCVCGGVYLIDGAERVFQCNDCSTVLQATQVLDVLVQCERDLARMQRAFAHFFQIAPPAPASPVMPELAPVPWWRRLKK